MSLKHRLERLEQMRCGEGWEPWNRDARSLDEVIAALGTDPAAVRALVADRTCSLAEATAELLGVSYKGFQAVIKTRGSEFEASHDWRWQNGRCYVRRTA